MAVREYLKACHDIFQSGLLKGDILKKHIEQQIMIDEFLPDSASFFFVVEPVNHTYHFIGKQQESVSGYSNEEVMSRGMEFLFACLHPDEVDILQDKIYPKIASTLGELSQKEDIKKTVTQFNYRFKPKSGMYLNFLEHLYVLETDQAGKPALFLGNIIILGSNEVLPMRLTIKIARDYDLLKIIFSDTYNSNKPVLANITTRELDILHKLAMGKTSKQIGKELFISNHTVDTHRRNLLQKLKCNSVVELTRFAFQNGLL
jgi:DNA-binding CsgD family transcriptional regulator